MTNSGRDRRRFARVPLQTKVRVVFPGAEARTQLFLDNISAQGLFIRMKAPKPVGTTVSFEFLVRDGGQPIVGKGVVRWIEDNPTKTQGMGIQFTELNEEGKEELRKILRRKNATR